MTQRSIKIILFLVVVGLIISHMPIVFADQDINIESVTFNKYVDEFGYEDESLAYVCVKYTAPSDIAQLAILLASEDITEITEDNLSKVIYMNQTARTDGDEISFIVEKDRIALAANTDNIDGVLLYVKIGSVNMPGIAAFTVVFRHPGALDTAGLSGAATYNSTKDKITVTGNIINLPDSGLLSIAVYDANDKLIGIKIIRVNTESEQIVETFDNCSDYQKIALYLWDSSNGMKPISSSYIIEQIN